MMVIRSKLVVEAGVYGLDFWFLSEIKHGGVIIRPVKDFEAVREKLGSAHDHLLTGVASVEIPNNVDKHQAIEFARKELEDYSLLLSFAQGRNIFFRGFKLFKHEEGRKEFLSSVNHSTRTGFPVSHGAIVYQDGLQGFLATGIPLLRDEEHNKRTGLRRAMLFYNEALFLSSGAIEIRMVTLYAGLEVLSNKHHEVSPLTPVVTDDELRSITERIKHHLNELKLDKSKQDRILGGVGSILAPSMKEKTIHLLNDLGLPSYKKEVEKMVQLRNDLLHGREPTTYDGDNVITLTFKLERLLQKIFLKILNFYDKERYIHSAVLNNNLEARF